MEKVQKSEAEWRAELTPEQYEVLRKKGTERAFTGAYWDTKDEGVYRCAGCGQELFSSDTKFDSGAPASRSARGRATEPSGRWRFSIRAISVRPTATAVPLSVCTGTGCASG